MQIQAVCIAEHIEGKLHCGIVHRGLKVFLGVDVFPHFLYLFIGYEGRCVEKVSHILVDVEVQEIFAFRHDAVHVDEGRVHPLPEEGKKRCGFFLVQRGIVAVVLFLQVIQTALNCVFYGSAFALNCAQHIVDETEGKHLDFNLVGAFVNKVEGFLDGRSGRGCGGNPVKGLAIFLHPFRILVHPLDERLFPCLLAGDDVKVPESLFLALPFLAIVGGHGIFVGILEHDGRVRAHGVPHEILPHKAGVDCNAVHLLHVLQLGCGLEALGAAGIAHDHSVIAFLNALERDFEVALGFQGNVVLVIIGRLAFFIGIYAEHGEISGVAGPFPVVRIAAELADRGRGCAHETNVRVVLIDDEVEDVAVVEGFHHHLASGIRFLGVVLDERFRQGACCWIRHLVRYILHVHEELHGEPRDGNLLVALERPVAVHQVIVLRGAELLDAAIPAVVVGEQKAVLRNDFSGATAVELHHGVLQRTVIHAVDVFRREPASFTLHNVDVHALQKREQPHSFIGPRSQTY